MPRGRSPSRCAAGCPGPAVSARALRDRSWWTGPRAVPAGRRLRPGRARSAAAAHPLLPLVEFLPQAKDVGLHVVVARRCGGAARALFDPLLGRLRELGAAALRDERQPGRGAADRRGQAGRVAARARDAGRPPARGPAGPAGLAAATAEAAVADTVSGSPSRVAVQVGARTVRVAGATADGEPWLVAERPGPGPAVARAAVRAGRCGARRAGAGAPAELAGAAGGRGAAGSWRAGRAGARRRRCRSPRPAPGPCVVLDVGHTGTEVTRLARRRIGSSVPNAPVGGAQLDEVLAGWLRRPLAGLGAGPGSGPPAGPRSRRGGHAAELAPLGPAVRPRRADPGAAVAAAGGRRRASPARTPRCEIRATDVDRCSPGRCARRSSCSRAVLGEGGPAPVLLIGGVARAPLLAELVDAAGCPDVRGGARGPERRRRARRAPLAARRPTRAAMPPVVAVHRGPRVRAGGRAGGRTGRRDRLMVGADGCRCGRRNRPAGRSLFPLPRRRPLVPALLARRAPAGRGAARARRALSRRPPRWPLPAGVLVQYGYRLDVPAGWEHTGGLPQRRRVLLTPAAAPEGSDVIAVERTPARLRRRRGAAAGARRAAGRVRRGRGRRIRAVRLPGRDARRPGGGALRAARPRTGAPRSTGSW